MNLPAEIALIVAIFYSIHRLLFFLLNYSSFSQFGVSSILVAFFQGLRFDFSVISMIQGVLLLVLTLLPLLNKIQKKIWLVLFLVSLLPTFLLNCVDLAFFAFQGKRTTADLLQVLNTGEDAAALMPQYIKDFWHVVLIWLLSVFLCLRLVNKKINAVQSTEKINPLTRLAGFLLLGGFLFLAARGSVELRPLSPIFAARENPGLAPLQLNSPFVFIKSLGKATVTETKYFEWSEIPTEFKPVCTPNNPSKTEEKKNIVIVVVESLGAEYMNTYNPGKGLTPFLDSLAQFSRVYQNAYANGKTSIQGIPSVFSAMPSLFDGAYITSPFGSNESEGIPACLAQWGYSTAFFHGGKNGTMGFDSYASTAGFGKYYGKNEYPNPKDYDGHWGIYDEDFLGFAADKISGMPSPFMAGIFTISSHHPYTVPIKLKGRFKEGPLSNSQSVRYADYSLGKFFLKIKNLPWYKNTLFVITADHTSIAGDAYFGGAIGMFRIPILIFDPQGTSFSPGLSEQVVQQCDIQKILLSELAYPRPYFNFACMLNGNAIMRNNGMIQVVNDTVMYQFDGEKITGIFDRQNDSLAANNLVGKCPVNELNAMEKQVKIFLQQYAFALNRNAATSGKWSQLMIKNSHEK